MRIPVIKSEEAFQHIVKARSEVPWCSACARPLSGEEPTENPWKFCVVCFNASTQQGERRCDESRIMYRHRVHGNKTVKTSSGILSQEEVGETWRNGAPLHRYYCYTTGKCLGHQVGMEDYCSELRKILENWDLYGRDSVAEDQTCQQDTPQRIPERRQENKFGGLKKGFLS